jgi:hypothetical protein
LLQSRFLIRETSDENDTRSTRSVIIELAYAIAIGELVGDLRRLESANLASWMLGYGFG